MSLIMISYDLKGPKRNYTDLIEAIKSEHNWWHYLDSFWLVDSSKSVEYWTKKLNKHIDEDDNLLVMKISIEDYNGHLPQKAYDWIHRKEFD
ncbi:hypothetical protein [Leptospira yasudae]|uniref:hypothetical protein n=1 Tax=Leptospira yasudae TaxID=2202201 RepID=UPI001090B9A2|nr:hypothetical protein [Leptospira yasudae]TGM95977.1 hypothetical protein EHR10_18260 [Leptospira yasudae]